MTLIINAVGEDFAVQVSDRRLTLPSGALHNDSANKAICVLCQDAKFAMSYTGLARIRNKRTDEWLTDELADMSAGSLTYSELICALKERLDTALAPLHYWGKLRGLTIVTTGFRPTGPFSGQLSNTDDKSAHRLSLPSDEFSHHYWFPDIRRMRSLALFAYGAEQAVFQTDKKSLSKIGKQGLKKPPSKTVTALVQVVRIATRHATLGHLIGKNCMSALVNRQGDFECKYHPELATATVYGPSFIRPNMAIKGAYAVGLSEGWTIRFG